MDVFTLFPTVSYKFLVLKQGGVLGNTVEGQYSATGVLKTRDGLNQTGNAEAVTSEATMHIRPDETFLAAVGSNLVGHGIQAEENGALQTYRIVGQRGGRNFDTNQLEFYLVTLKREAIEVEDDES